MDFVFYEVTEYEQTIRTVLSEYLLTRGKAGVFHSLSRKGNKVLDSHQKDTEYLIFYRIFVPYESRRIRIFLKENNLKSKIVALCRNDKDGIRAMGKGNDYALLLPLDPNMIIHCYRHFQPEYS